MKTKKTVLGIISFIMLCVGIQLISVTASAADNPYNYSSEPSRAIYYTIPTMRGDDVKWVQAALNAYGGYGLDLDGSFGPACKEATRKFQASRGLDQDGSFGPATRANMVIWLSENGYYRTSTGRNSGNSGGNGNSGGSIPYSQPTRAIYYTIPTMRGDDVKWVQEALNRFGNYGLSIDGSFGPACADATRRFQASRGLAQDGSFGPATRSNMINWLKDNGISSSQRPSEVVITPNSTTVKYNNNGSINSFLNDDRWKVGTYWGSSKRPEISGWDSLSCCAYCADFVKYVYGKDDLTKCSYISLNDVNAGDVIYTKYNGGNTHYFVVTERNGNNLKAAERWSDYIINDWNYSIENGVLYRNGREFNFQDARRY